MENKELTGKRTFSRRELLKVMAASGGALAAGAFLPARWVRPFVQGGVLPAHAQLTGCAILDVESMDPYPCAGAANGGCPPGYAYYIPVEYEPERLMPVAAVVKICDRAWPLAVHPVEPGLVFVLITQKQYEEGGGAGMCEPWEAYLQLRFANGCYARYYFEPPNSNSH